MSDHARRAEIYRAKAEEIRTIAESMKDPTPRKILLGVADDYLHMADLVGQMGPVGRRSPSRD